MMTHYIIKRETLQSMADALRGKLDTSAPMLVADMASKITSIVGEGSSMKLDVFPEQTVSGFEYDSEYNRYTPGGMSPAPFALRKDETYHVVWNGVEFTCTAQLINYSGMNLIYIGDPSFIGLPAVDTPFTAVYMPGEEMSGIQIFTTDNKSEQLIRVYQLVNELPDDTYLKMTDGALEFVNIDDFIGEATADLRYVTFMSRDGAQTYGVKPTAVGDDCADPIARGLFGTPTRESTDADDFVFSGWSKSVLGPKDADALLAVTEDRTLYATFNSSVRSYTITYLDSDGVTVLHTETLSYGAMPSYTPEKEGYKFIGWAPELSTVVSDVNYTAQWEVQLALADYTWAQIDAMSLEEAQSKFKLGDIKDKYMLVGFNHDTLVSGGKAKMSFLYCNLTSSYSFKYSSSIVNSYKDHYFRMTQLVGDPSTYVPGYADISPVAKAVNKKYLTNRTSGSALSTATDKFWMVSASELGYKVDGSTVFDEGARYELFSEKDHTENMTKDKPDGFSGLYSWSLGKLYTRSGNPNGWLYLESGALSTVTMSNVTSHSTTYKLHGFCL